VKYQYAESDRKLHTFLREGPQFHVDLLGFLGTTLGESSGFADAITQVVELRTSHNTMSNNIELGDLGRVQREDTLHSFSGDNFTHGECRVDPIASSMSDHNADKLLNSFFIAFLDSAMNTHGVADLERERFFSKTSLFDNVKCFVSHDSNPLSGGRGAIRLPKSTCPLDLRCFRRMSPTEPGC
jgi:hypothetical protein